MAQALCLKYKQQLQIAKLGGVQPRILIQVVPKNSQGRFLIEEIQEIIIQILE